MKKQLSVAFVMAGVVLLTLGIQASNSFGSDVSRLFTGSPTDKAIWLLLAGILAIVVGLVGVVRGDRR